MAAAETGGEMSTAIERSEEQREMTLAEWVDQLPQRHLARKEFAALVEDRDEYRNRMHMAETKVMSRDQIIKQLSETELAKDVARLEEQLADARRALLAE